VTAGVARVGRAPWASAPPPPPQPGDGNRWITGRCMLYCLQPQVLVLWIGPATCSGATAPLYACAGCIAILHRLIHASHEAEGVPEAACAPACRAS